MCPGRPPFRAATTLAVLRRVCEDAPRPIREVNPDIPDWLAEIIVKLHAKDPADRFASAAEVATAPGRPAGRAPASDAQQGSRNRRSRSPLPGLAAAWRRPRSSSWESSPSWAGPRPRPLTNVSELRGHHPADQDGGGHALRPGGRPGRGRERRCRRQGIDHHRRGRSRGQAAAWPAPVEGDQGRQAPARGADHDHPGRQAGRQDRTRGRGRRRASRGEGRAPCFGERRGEAARAIRGGRGDHAADPDGAFVRPERGAGTAGCDSEGRGSSPAADRPSEEETPRFAGLGVSDWQRARDRSNAPRPVASFDAGTKLKTTAVAYSPDGKTLALASIAAVQLWDVKERKLLASLADATEPNWANTIISLAYSPDGSSLAAGSFNGTVTVWDVARRAKRFETHHKPPEDKEWPDYGVWKVAYSPDGKWLASASWDDTVRLWDARTGQEYRVLKHPGKVRTLAFSPDGTTWRPVWDSSPAENVRLWSCDVVQRARRLRIRALPRPRATPTGRCASPIRRTGSSWRRAVRTISCGSGTSGIEPS